MTDEQLGQMKLIFNYNDVFYSFSMMTSAAAYIAPANMPSITSIRVR